MGVRHFLRWPVWQHEGVDFRGPDRWRRQAQGYWAAVARVGYLVAPMVFSYVNAGYTGSDWDGATLFNPITAGPIGLHTGSFNTQGWFVGGGVENNLDIFGISAPGWFMKTEYRAAYYDNKNVNILVDGSNAGTPL